MIRHWIWFAPLATCLWIGAGSAATITISGSITQSTEDGTGPAVNNPLLNNIQGGQEYLITAELPGPVTGPGDYTPSSLTFSVPGASAVEASFGFISLTITANGAFHDISLLGCLTTGSGTCPPFAGNGLTANFRIAAAMLNSLNVSATGLDLPHPLDLLEDDGTTDIQGSITDYSYTNVPEPSRYTLLGVALVAVAALKKPGDSRTHH